MDLRIPSGFFFAAVGTVLCAMGLLAPATRARLTDVNVNLVAGGIMLCFGGLLLWLSRRKS
jgi:hypothetical protein